MPQNTLLKEAVVRARVSKDLKSEVEGILNEVGLTVSEAIRLFLTRVKLEHGIPFEIKIPNAITAKAIHDMENDIDVETAEDTDDLWNKLSQ